MKLFEGIIIGLRFEFSFANGTILSFPFFLKVFEAKGADVVKQDTNLEWTLTLVSDLLSAELAMRVLVELKGFGRLFRSVDSAV